MIVDLQSVVVLQAVNLALVILVLYRLTKIHGYKPGK